jgi:Flp pilus assembly pilin Flp
MSPITFFKRICQENSGQGLTEYLILLILIAVTCITTVTTLGSRIETKLQKASEKINSVSVTN